MTFIAIHSTSPSSQPSGAGRSALRRVITVSVASLTLSSVCAAAVFETAGAAPITQAAQVSADTQALRLIGSLADEAAALLDAAVATRGTTDFAQYAKARQALADVVAGRLGVDTDAMSAAWAEADTVHQEALMAALSQLGVRYRRNTSIEGEGFDCSGLTSWAWGQAGVPLSRNSSSQIRSASARSVENAQAGDLVQYPGHVMMWLGVELAVVHAPRTGRTVELALLPAYRRVRLADPTA